MRKIILALAVQVALCANLASQQLYYTVKFPDDQTIVGCGASAPTNSAPIIQYFGNCNFNVGVSVKDQVFNLNATGGCKKILRTWKLVWWCDYDPNWAGPTSIPNPSDTDTGPTVNGNSANHGYLQYTQIIKIIDNDAPVFLNCPDAPILFCDFTNNDPAQYGSRCEGPVDLKIKVTDLCSKSDITVTYRLYLDLDGNGSMETYRSSSAPDAWPIEKTISADTVSAKIKSPAGVGLPYGKHKIEWIAADGCGNQSICKYDFEVKDCQPPTVVCINGLSINIMPTGMVTLWASDFLHYMTDNCTPTDLLKLAIRKSGTGTGFPAFNTSVTFDCNEIGKQYVEIWAEDATGNAGYCETFINVQDNIGACTPTGTVSGNIMTDLQQALPGAKVLLKNNLSALPQQSTVSTDAEGKFWFASAPGTCNYSIIPALDTLPLLGVNTLDVMLSDWHISGQALLPTPYKIIAADANLDGALNSQDLDAMSNLIIGTANSFLNNTAWRFVPKAYAFPNPLAPLAGMFPEKISTTCPAGSGDNQHFIAIKTGDVDGSADLTNALGTSDDRVADEGTATFRITNRRFGPGDEVTATLIAPNLNTMLGFQFTLFADPNLLELQSVQPMLTARVGAFTDQNRVAVSWYTKPGESDGERAVIMLKFKALQYSTLKQALQINSSVTAAEVYDMDRHTMAVALQFVQPSLQNNLVNLLTVAPNPTSGPITAEFYLPERANISLSLSDQNGRTVSSQHDFFEAGWHKVAVPVGATQVSGLYALRLQSPFGSEIQRVILQR